jgi:ubiquinone/menaquinone biosynthesis C-methylase UbiE
VVQIRRDPADSKTEVVARMIASDFHDVRRLLVVGCGSGLEAAILAERLGVEVVGIDIEISFLPHAAERARLLTCDARSLPFGADTFDFAYSFHALEHIPEPQRALDEVRRVLRSGGGYFIGTPNRSRLVGYLGSKNASMRQKIGWNAEDWRARLAGRFRNEYGAHAGFTARELGAMLRAVFSECTDSTGRYYRDLYRAHATMVRTIIALRLGRWLFPSVYFTGRVQK